MKKKIFCVFLSLVLLVSATIAVHARERSSISDYEVEQTYSERYFVEAHVEGGAQVPLRIRYLVYYSIHTVWEYPDFVPRTFIFDNSGILLDINDCAIPHDVLDIALYQASEAFEHDGECYDEFTDTRDNAPFVCTHRRFIRRLTSGPNRHNNTATHCHKTITHFSYFCEDACRQVFRWVTVTDLGPEHRWQNVPNRPGQQVCSLCFNIR